MHSCSQVNPPAGMNKKLFRIPTDTMAAELVHMQAAGLPTAMLEAALKAARLEEKRKGKGYDVLLVGPAAEEMTLLDRMKSLIASDDRVPVLIAEQGAEIDMEGLLQQLNRQVDTTQTNLIPIKAAGAHADNPYTNREQRRRAEARKRRPHLRYEDEHQAAQVHAAEAKQRKKDKKKATHRMKMRGRR